MLTKGMENQQKTILGILALIVVVGLIWWGSARRQGTRTQETVQIGVILPLSGSAAYYGEQSRKGIEMAKNALSREFPNLKVNLLYDNSFYTTKGGVDAYNNLKVRTNLDAVITAASQVSLAVLPLTQQEGVLQMAIFSSADSYTSPGDLSFRVSTRGEVETSRMADFIAEQKYGSVAVIYLNNDFGVSYLQSLKQHLSTKAPDVQVVSEEGYLLDTSDFRTQLAKIKQDNPDAVFVVGPAAHIANVLKQAHENGFTMLFLSMRAAEDPVLLRNAGQLADGLIFTYPFDPNTSRTAKVFAQEFERQHSAQPDAYAAEGYEGMMVVGRAFAKCGKDPACLGEYIKGLQDYDSVLGSLRFNENGDVVYNYFLKTVKDGKFVPYQQ